MLYFSRALTLIVTLLAAVGLTLAPTTAQARDQARLAIEAPTSVSPGWDGQITVSGYSSGADDYLSISIERPDGTRYEDGASIYDYSWEQQFYPGPFNQPGRYYVEAFTYQSGETATAVITVATAAPAFKVANLSRDSFYPTVRDGYREDVRISWQPNGRLPVAMKVLNSAGRMVKWWPAKTWRPYGPDVRYWRGLNNAGDTVPVGRYRIVMTATGADGRTATKTLPVRVASDVVTRRAYDTWNGLQTWKRDRRGDCYMQGWSYDGSLDMNCYDYGRGSSARAEYWFRLPKNARNIRWGISGRVRCCSPGDVDRNGKRVHNRKFVVSMRITGLRSYTLDYAWVRYTYKARR